jgi:heat shock protein HslJ
MKRKIVIISIFILATGVLSSCKIFSKRQRTDESPVAKSELKGNWEMNYISGMRIAFQGLYPQSKPSMTFDLVKNEVNGNTSCNGFISKITVDGNKINISEPGPMTMRYCEGGGEKPFLEMLKKITSYNVNGDTLTLIQGDIAVMRFNKK